MINEDHLLAKLKERPGRGGVRLSYDEAMFLADLIENPRLTQLGLRVLIDQAKRAKMNSPIANMREDGVARTKRPKPPVLRVALV